MKNFRQIFKEYARSKTLTSYHVVQHCILKAMSCDIGSGIFSVDIADRHIHRAFTPVTRKIKLDNGREPYDTVLCALRNATNDSMRYFEDSDKGLDEFVVFKEIVDGLIKKYDRPVDYFSRYYFYVFVRQDISPEYQAVQGMHAAAKMGHYCHSLCTNIHFDDLYLTLIGVPDVQGLFDAIKDATALGCKVYNFYEPDLGGQLTAVATSPIRMCDRKRLLSYKRLRFDK